MRDVFCICPREFLPDSHAAPKCKGFQTGLSASRLCQAVGRVYGTLQISSERSAMVTRALDYVGDALKYIKPSLVSKNQKGIQLAYWALGKSHMMQFRSMFVYSDVLTCGVRKLSLVCLFACLSWTLRVRLRREALEPPAGHIQGAAVALPHCGSAAPPSEPHSARHSSQKQPATLSPGLGPTCTNQIAI